MLPIIFQEEQANANEPEEIRGLTKTKLYDLLLETCMLPSNDSKGVTRTYLVSVFNNQVLRLRNVDILRFEAELPASACKKTVFVNLNDVAHRLNVILDQLNERPLGFPAHLAPEEKWLMRVVRFAGQFNVLGIFANPLPNPREQDFLSLRIYRAKRQAEQYLMGQGNLLRNGRVFAQVKEVAENKRRLSLKQGDLQELEDQVANLNLRIHSAQGLLQSSILRAAMTIMAVGNDLEDTDQIFIEGEQQVNYRGQLQQICRL